MSPLYNDSLTLCQRALGPQFELLRATLREFHSRPHGGTAVGRLDIVRGEGPLRNLVASLLRLPPDGKHVPVTVEVRVHEGGETWLRVFGRHRMVTYQWLDGPFIVERAGPLRIWFRVEASDSGMRFASVTCTVFGILLPRLLAFRVTANVIGTNCGWWVEVEVCAPILGALVRYEGEVTPN